LERRIESSPYPISDKVASIKQRSFANLKVSSNSLEKSAVQHRSMLAAIRGDVSPAINSTTEKRASNDERAEELATQYALYKLAALQHIASFDSDFPLTAMFSVRQNYIVT